jgi:hypothetical protein
VVTVAVIAVGLLTWVGVTLLIDGWLRRDRRPDLAERLRPFLFEMLADETQRWLDERYRP